MRNFIRLVESADKGCPVETQDPELNLKNKQEAVKEHMYGPSDPDNPGDYWIKLGEKLKVPTAEAEKKTCGNCKAFNVTEEMKRCIGDDTNIGYCEFLKFSCSAMRSCDAWLAGGPIKSKD